MASLPSKHINCTTQLGVIHKLAEGALNPTAYVIGEDTEQYRSQATGHFNISRSLQLEEELCLVRPVLLGATSATVYPSYANFGPNQGHAVEKKPKSACRPCCHGRRQQGRPPLVPVPLSSGTFMAQDPWPWPPSSRAGCQGG